MEIVVNRPGDDRRERRLVAEEVQRYRVDGHAVLRREEAGRPVLVERRALPFAGGIEAVFVVLGRVEAVDEVEECLAPRLLVPVQIDQAVVGAHPLHHRGTAAAATKFDGDRGVDVARARFTAGREERSEVIFGADRHAGQRVPFQAGDVDHIVGLGDAGREIEREAALRQEKRLRLVDHGFLPAVGAGRIDEVDAGKFLRAAIENRGGDVADGIEAGDVSRGDAPLLDQLPQQRLHKLRCDVGRKGSVAVVVRLVQVEFDDDLLARLVADRAFAFALVEIGEDLLPGFFVAGGVAHGTDRVRQHLGDDFGMSVGVIPPAGGAGRAVPRRGRGIKGPRDATRLDSKGHAHRRVDRFGGTERGLRGGLGRGLTLAVDLRGRHGKKDDGPRDNGQCQAAGRRQPARLAQVPTGPPCSRAPW